MRLESYKRNIKASLGIRDFKGSKINNIGSKGQTKDLKKKKRLSGFYNNNNSLKVAHV